MRLILGIGNPGAEYDGTRHNLGFAVIDELARRHGLSSWSHKWHSQACEWWLPVSWGGDKAWLLKPQTYVNLSGEAAQAALAFLKLPPSDLLVVVDDLALPLGHLRLRADGSAGGHNGLRDLEARIGKAYARLRLGMGPLPPGAEQVGFVLGRFAPDQKPVADELIKRGADCVEAWIRQGVAVACRFNGPPASELEAKSKKPEAKSEKPEAGSGQPPTA
jgi:PTH1 family peptidyl-tRNA hydrolase